MIITKLQGGLGNQMFQYAFGLAVAERLGAQLKLDCSHYLVDRKRLFDLDKFNISAGLASDSEIGEFTKRTLTEKLLLKQSSNVIKEPSPTKYYGELLEAPDDSYLEGLWQNEKYFKAIENQIRQEYTFKGLRSLKFNDISKQIENSNSLSIHIRRGDYLLKKHWNVYNVCPIDYYKEAIAKIKEKIGQIEIFVFSDDPEWVKINISSLFPFTLVSNGDFSIPEEHALMSYCKHNIIANSTYSWWAAWLNPNEHKVVISPKRWLAIDSDYEKNIIPQSWIKI